MIESGQWLPLVFAGLIALAILIYAVLDGYDLGVGVLMVNATNTEQDNMIASIGPFWDANETWLVLGIGLMLVAFPEANHYLLSKLYLPFTIMILSLIIRGVAFDFRVKAKTHHQKTWNHAFFAGSLGMALSQGYILGSYILGFQSGLTTQLFSGLVALSVTSAYSLIGAAWLIMKSDGILQQKAIKWCRVSAYCTLLGILLISVITPICSPRIYQIWFTFPNIMLLWPMLIVTIAFTITLLVFLNKLATQQSQLCWVPFLTTIGIFLLCFNGLAYSFYPYIIPDKITIFQTTTSLESFKIMLIGTIIVLPLLISYTAFAYKVFHGKTKELTYD